MAQVEEPPEEFDMGWLGDFIDRLSEFDREMNQVVVDSGGPPLPFLPFYYWILMASGDGVVLRRQVSEVVDNSGEPGFLSWLSVLDAIHQLVVDSAFAGWQTCGLLNSNPRHWPPQKAIYFAPPRLNRNPSLPWHTVLPAPYTHSVWTLSPLDPSWFPLAGILAGIKKGALSDTGAAIGMKAGCLELLQKAASTGIPTWGTPMFLPASVRSPRDHTYFFG
jgi:hypothetical protein